MSEALQPTAPKTCLNCGKMLKDKHKFCPGCGQSAKVTRVQMRDIQKQTLKKLIHADSEVLNLLRGMATAPGLAVREYLDGKRKKYYPPVRFLFLMTGISVFLNEYFHLLERMPGGNGNPATEVATRFFNLILLAVVPISAVFSWLLFRSKGYNYAEHLVLHSFLTGFRVFFFVLVFTPLALFLPGYYYTALTVYVLVWLIYFSWAMVQFFGKPWGLTLLKTILTFLLSQIVITFFVSLAVLIIKMQGN